MKNTRQTKHFTANKWIALGLTLTFLITSCKNAGENEETGLFPEVQTLSDFDSTLFVPTLESPFNNDKNSVYAATLLMAWDEIKNTIDNPISEIESTELQRMNKSKTYQEVLSPDEYSTEVNIEGREIIARAYFRKSLPFIKPLWKDHEPLSFMSAPVNSFGFDGKSSVAGILYYHNDDDFAIMLRPKEKDHEIILVKTAFPDEIILKNEVDKLDQNIKSFHDAYDVENRWKYYLNDDDRCRIPIIEFNIESNFPDIENTFFYTPETEYLVTKAWLRNAFILNEKGAEVESVAEMVAEEAIEEELPKPKKLIFDKAFLVILKKNTSNYPYFALYIANPELLQKSIQK